jgi:GNAT superfamily N-acetyltransferase
MTNEPNERFRGDEEVREVVRKFESCELRPAEFKHRLHLTVALSYLLEAPYTEALERMRLSLHRFIQTHGIGPRLYHETLTAFWMRRVLAFVEQADKCRGLAELANELIEACGDSRLVYEYYSKERLDSDKARKVWLDSDLKPLDF